jgi:hypothetical protein
MSDGITNASQNGIASSQIKNFTRFLHLLTQMGSIAFDAFTRPKYAIGLLERLH